MELASSPKLDLRFISKSCGLRRILFGSSEILFFGSAKHRLCLQNCNKLNLQFQYKMYATTVTSKKTKI